ncbi:MAG: LCP family protein [Lachnospiraceae bacterium]|nr:LCP family protein [Lachnospiraceae bacterium]
MVIIMLICGLALGGFETAKAMGKRRLQSESEGAWPDLQTAIDTELQKEEAIKWQDGWVKYQDTIYQYNQDILTFLIMGIDKNSDATAVEEGTEGGQADALFLAVMNPKDNSIKIIGINRNTMTDIDIYNGEGAYITTTKAQIAVQHGFGDGMEKSCEYQKKAVKKLFYNLPIHGYAAVNMSAIPTINDTVGGIDVTVLEDLTKVDDSLVKDSNVHLSGESAFWYVEYRDTDVFGSADMRLVRQQQYLTKLVNVAKQKVREDVSVALSLYQAISPQMVTDVSAYEAAYLASVLSNYKFDQNSFYMMQGETVRGEEFEEFYPDEDALYEMILDVFYEKVE